MYLVAVRGAVQRRTTALRPAASSWRRFNSSGIKAPQQPTGKASASLANDNPASSLDWAELRAAKRAAKKEAEATAKAEKAAAEVEAAKLHFQAQAARELKSVHFSRVTSPRNRNIVPLKRLAGVAEESEEREWHSEHIRGRAVLKAFRHDAPYRAPVAILHFRSHFPALLDLFTHFAEHAAASLGVPITGVARLPTQRSLWTVIRGPFAHKKSQENFHRLVHKRAIRAFDADPEVVDRLVTYLERHAMEGVGLRVVRWHRVPVGIGRAQVDSVASYLRLGSVPVAEQVKQLGEQIIVEEMKAVGQVAEAPRTVV